jgi:hypothetical protein
MEEDESPYRKNARPMDKYCIDCGKPPHGEEKRCIMCTVGGRKSAIANRGIVGVVLLALVGWAGLATFGTFAGYLIDASDGEITNGSEIAGGACFCMGALVFGFIIVVLAWRWVVATGTAKSS